MLVYPAETAAAQSGFTSFNPSGFFAPHFFDDCATSSRVAPISGRKRAMARSAHSAPTIRRLPVTLRALLHTPRVTRSESAPLRLAPASNAGATARGTLAETGLDSSVIVFVASSLLMSQTRSKHITSSARSNGQTGWTGSSRIPRGKSLQAYPEAWLAAIVESSDDAIIGKTLDSRIRSWNTGATRIFGYQPHEILGESVLILFPPDRRHEEPEIIDRLVRGERVECYDTVRVRKEGSSVDVSLSISPIRDSEGTILGAAKIARDITEAKALRKAEHDNVEQLQQLTTELEQQVEEARGLQEELERANSEPRPGSRRLEGVSTTG